MIVSVGRGFVKPRIIEQVVEILRNDGVIVYPTDTTYGIGCSIFSRRGIERIYRIKEREKGKPMSFICSSISEISRYARVDDRVFKILKKTLPGPYTFILEATRIVPDLVMTRQKTVGIRMPDNPVCRALVEQLGNPVITTSANRSGSEPIGDPHLIHDEFGNLVDLVIDGGILPSAVSTVISLVGPEPEVIRPGVGDTSWCTR